MSDLRVYITIQCGRYKDTCRAKRHQIVHVDDLNEGTMQEVDNLHNRLMTTLLDNVDKVVEEAEKHEHIV